MATRPMKTISGLPGLEGNTYTFVQIDNQLATAGKAADAKAVGDELAEINETLPTKANVDGSYEQMTVGNAEQLVSTVGIEDKVPYNFRTAGGANDIGDREVDKVVGGTVAWNQLVKNGDFASNSDWTIIASNTQTLAIQNGVATVTVIEHNSSIGIAQANSPVPKLSGHKLYFSAYVNPSTATRVRFGTSTAAGNYGIPSSADAPANTWTHLNQIGNIASGNTGTSLLFYVNSGALLSANDTVQIKNVCVFDLTQMFGSTIADYIYSLETATAGAGVAWFRKLFPAPYYAYNAGELMSVSTNAHKMVGFNAWDGSAGVIVGSYRLIDVPTLLLGKCSMTLKDKDTSAALPNGCAIGFVRADWEPSQGALTNQDYRWVYYAGAIRSNTSNTSGGTSAADGDKLLGKILIYPSTLAAFEAITSRFYMGVNLSWDGERDGEYEPYEAHTYPLDDVELRGIPKLDSDNNLYYDGDTYESDGTVTRKYGIVDLGTLTWAYNSSSELFYTSPAISDIKGATLSQVANIVCDKYVTVNGNSDTDKSISVGYRFVANGVNVKDSAYSDAAAFKTAMSGVYLVYELATPTTEEADPYQNPQIVDDFGTEEYVDAPSTASTPTRDVAIPVGHETVYAPNLRAKLEMAPDSPADGDGDYIVRQTNGENSYVKLIIPTELPANPSTDGTYHLKATVSSGTTTLTWEADE